MTDSNRHPRLTDDPLSMVLCQVRFTAVQKIHDYMADIQDVLRRTTDFKEDISGEMRQIVMQPGKPPEEKVTHLNEFRTVDGHWAVTISKDQAVLVTTDYSDHVAFRERLSLILTAIDEKAELRHNLVRRVGLRYVDVIQPVEGESWRDYLKPCLHGLQSDYLDGATQQIFMQSVARSEFGTLALRLSQNNQGNPLPPDVVMPRPMATRTKFQNLQGKMITLVDSDHFWEGSMPFSTDAIMETHSALHRSIVDLWFDDVITDHAKTNWGATYDH